MKTRIAALFFLSGILFSAFAQSQPVAWDKDGEEWMTRRSAHFDIHYLQSYESMAQKALAIAEQVHDELVPYFGQAPEVRTQMVITDDVDYSNGWATPWPYNQIRLFASPPEDVNGLEHMDGWLHGLIRHEYVHILHLDMNSGITTSGRDLFGRFYLFFPHIFSPSLFKEGLAVHLETNKQLGYGRLDSSFYDMQLRMEVAGPGPDALDQAVLTLDDWPSNKAYLYGGYFMDYLARTYGDDDIGEYLQRYSNELVPYVFQNHEASNTFGRRFDGLWSGFRNQMTEAYEPVLASLQEDEVAGNDVVSEPAYAMVTAASGPALLWVSNNGKDKSQLLRSETGSDAENTRRLTSAKGVSDMDMGADGTLAVARQISYASGRVFNDIFLWRADDGWQRLTHQMRLRKVRWVAPEYLLASRKQHGLSELWWLDREGNSVMLWQGGEGLVLGGFDVSADGSRLVAAIKRPQQGWNLEQAVLPAVMTAESLDWQPLTQTRATENSPVFLPDDRVLFSADYDGIYNLHILNPRTGQAQQITRVVSGAFRPQWLAGRVAYQEYTREGYQLRLLTPQAQGIRRFAISDYQGRYDYPRFPSADRAAPDSGISTYSPWSSLMPAYWFPWWTVEDNSTVLGITTSGTDALNRHNYSLVVGWDTQQDWAEGQFVYQYDNRWSLAYQRSHSFEDLNLPLDDDYLAFREDLVVLSRRYIWHAFEDQLALHAGAVYDDEKLVRMPPLVDAQYHYREGLAGAALTFDNREYYRHVAGVGWGTYVDLVYESNDVIDSDFDGAQWQSRWQQTWDLPGRNTLQFTALGGRADRGAEPFTLGGGSTEENMIFGRDQFSLRGYDKGTQIGHQYYLASVNYQWWLGSVQRNWDLWPLGLGDYYFNTWYSRGSAWFRDQHRDALDSVGMEFTAQVVLGYSVAVPLTLGIAHGLNDDVGETQGYLSFQLEY